MFIINKNLMDKVDTIYIAPFVEESTKGIFLLILATSKKFDNVTDGLVYGGAIGLGFGMTENLLYFLSYGKTLHELLSLVVIRSFSKAWGLGAFSSAFLIASDTNIQILKDNYIIEEIPPIHLLATNYILQAPYRFVELINNFIAERKRVREHLRMLKGLEVRGSDTNFLMIKFQKNVKELYEQLCSKGIIIQTFENYPPFKDSEKCFLVTLGDSEINDRLIMSIVEILESIL